MAKDLAVDAVRGLPRLKRELLRIGRLPVSEALARFGSTVLSAPASLVDKRRAINALNRGDLLNFRVHAQHRPMTQAARELGRRLGPEIATIEAAGTPPALMGMLQFHIPSYTWAALRGGKSLGSAYTNRWLPTARLNELSGVVRAPHRAPTPSYVSTLQRRDQDRLIEKLKAKAGLA